MDSSARLFGVEWTVSKLVGVALALGAERVPMPSRGERELAAHAEPCTTRVRRAMRALIRSGQDPLGEVFCHLRAPRTRRSLGAIYTPLAIVGEMLHRAAEQGKPACVVDPGTGSGRFLVAAGQRFAGARLVGVEIDPLAALLARAHLACWELTGRSSVIVGDYCQVQLPHREGTRLFLGNPPYVRHHALAAKAKTWFVRTAKRQGLAASRLAGLHIHFLLATIEHARPGDTGALITAAEWLDVNYGGLARRLLAGGLGAYCVQRGNPCCPAFPDAQSTAAIAYFQVGDPSATVRLEQLEHWKAPFCPSSSVEVPRTQLAEAPRWSGFFVGRGLVQGSSTLGDWFSVHRGTATGMNRAWLRDAPLAGSLGRFSFRCVTRAHEILRAENSVLGIEGLRWIVDLPAELDDLSADERKQAEEFLEPLRQAGADGTYLARHRQPWWSLKLREPAPILVTYMARRPPRFVLNPRGAHHLNIAHGLYPRAEMSTDQLRAWVETLNGTIQQSAGRQYAGGLTKFEPGDLQRLPIRSPQTVRRRRTVEAVG